MRNKVLRLDDLYDLSAHETELLVVVEHGVHVLDPDRVHRTIEQDPLAVARQRCRVLTERYR